MSMRGPPQTKPESFYIATRGSPAYIPRVRALAAALVANGLRWTHDWTLAIEAARAAGISDADLSLGQRLAIARADAAGVRDADVLIYLSPDKEHRSEGAAWELGFFQGRILYGRCGLPIVVGPPNCLFMHLALQVDSDADVIDLLKWDAAAERKFLHLER